MDMGCGIPNLSLLCQILAISQLDIHAHSPHTRSVILTSTILLFRGQQIQSYRFLSTSCPCRTPQASCRLIPACNHLFGLAVLIIELDSNPRSDSVSTQLSWNIDPGSLVNGPIIVEVAEPSSAFHSQAPKMKPRDSKACIVR